MRYTIRPISKEELKTPISWAATEGWNPGIYDLESFYATDPHGFYMGFLDDEPIASLSAVAYDNSFGFVGFYIVKPEHRGKGYGTLLWKEALKHLPTQNIGLDGVLTQQKSYEKNGFTLAYKNIRFEGKGVENSTSPGSFERQNNFKIVPIGELPFAKLLEFDTRMFLVPRPVFLEKWVQQPESLALAAVKNSEICGYGMVRKCGVGYKVGPLFAKDSIVAEKILKEFMNFVGKDQSIFLDVPEKNIKGVSLAKKYQMKPVFETVRMYTKNQPKLPIPNIFGVTTFELG